LLEDEISLERGNLGGVRALRGRVEHQKENHPPKNTKIEKTNQMRNETEKTYDTRFEK
jgi:hypothetical protein